MTDTMNTQPAPKYFTKLENKKPGLAFLQNMWVRRPEELKRAIARAEAREPGEGEVLRMRMMEYALFAGCVTGARLEAAFGDMIDRIVWEETTREIAGDPKTIFPADLAHIRATIQKHDPDVVLTFGKIAEEAVLPVLMELKYAGAMIVVPHPAARQPSTIPKLREAAEQFKKFL